MDGRTVQVRWLAERLGAELLGNAQVTVAGLVPLATAQPHHLSFFADARYRDALQATRAGAVLVPQADAAELAKRHPDRAWLAVANPALAAATATALFCPPFVPPPGVHPSACVAAGADVAADASVGAHVVVDAGARVGAGCVLEAQSYVGRDAQLGPGVHLHVGAKVLAGCHVGARSILHAGCVVGSDGFGYVLDEARRRRVKVPQLGNVVVGCDVELGANTTVDRATFGSTRVGDGCKVDNLVMVAHNVQLGDDCVLVSQSGVAGSAVLGQRVIAGAQSGVVGHVRVADDVQLAARSGVSKDVTAAGTYGGLPLMPHRAWLRMMAALRGLVELRRDVAALRQQQLTAPRQERS